MHWAKEIWDIDINYCAGCSDGSFAFHDGMVCATKESNAAGVGLEVSKELYINPNGSIVGYGTDYSHIKRKVCGLMLPDTAWYCRLLLDTGACCLILPYTASHCLILPHAT